MVSHADTENLLRLALDNPHAGFRPGQWEAIERLVYDNARLLVVQRTGWGKSLVYFLATKLLRYRGAGLTLLISPLLALMRNQMLAAQRLGVKAVAIHSANQKDWQPIIREILADKVDILLISPERLANQAFQQQVLYVVAARIGLFVVDEAHCISDWGHDFRPDYRRIARILQALPGNVPVLATTATANDRVVADVYRQLGASLEIIRGPLTRQSLRLQNLSLPDPPARMAWLAQILPKIPGSGIVYTLTVGDAQRVAGWLQMNGIHAEAYWGSLENSRRVELEDQLLNNAVKVLVATSALGMGFDKPDLGFVIHYQRPASVIHYYQQVGRAGRAMAKAYGILLGGKEDDVIANYFFEQAFPPQAHAEAVLAVLARFSEEVEGGGASVAQLESRLNLRYGQIEKVLAMLAVENPSPVMKEGVRWWATPTPYRHDWQRVEQLRRLRLQEQERMRAYMEAQECLMVFLARELDDPHVQPCGHCAPCRGKPFAGSTYSNELAQRALQFLQNQVHDILPKKIWPYDALRHYGFEGRIPTQLQMEPGRALSLWSDGGWGDKVKQNKVGADFFDDELPDALAAMIQNSWQPTPPPTWVCAVPSLRHPERVPSLARRLSQQLGLPFVPCVEKIKDTVQQKMMSNQYQKTKNLDGAFMVRKRQTIKSPVLLVDDVVDSGWTLTVIAALLRQAGSGPVYPVALARMLPTA